MPARAVAIGEGDVLDTNYKHHCLVCVKEKHRFTYSSRINCKAVILVVNSGASDCDVVTITNIKAISVVAETITIFVINGDTGDSET